MTVHKLQKSGRSFFIYLPNQWIEENTLLQGNDLNVNLNKDSIIVTPLKSSQKIRKTSLNINIDNPDILAKTVTNLFVAGYDEFELNLNKELTKSSLEKLKELVNKLGLNMVDISSRQVKFYVNLSIDDLKRFTRDYIYKALNLMRMINEGGKLVDELITSFFYYRFITQRSIIKQNKLTPTEIQLYNTIAINLGRFLIHLKKLNDHEFLNKIKNIFEKILSVYDKPDFMKLVELRKDSEDIFEEEPENNEEYHKTRISRFIKDIIDGITINYFADLDSKN